MAAPLGNQFWKLREISGRPRTFTDPHELWEGAVAYFDWCDQNPLISVEYYGKDAIECRVPKMRAYTLTGLCVHLHCEVKTFTQLEKDEDFLPIYSRIRQIIYTQKFEGAAAGLLNANLVARDLGLTEKQEQKAQIISYNAEVTPDEAREISDALEGEV